MPKGRSKLSREIGRKRASMAREAGADAIVTICPWCEQNLSDHIPTFDLISLASDSL